MPLSTPIKVVSRPVAKLVPDPGNARTHGADQVRQIANSIERFGFTNPILISEGDVVTAGHGRLEAAKLLGIDKVPCIVLDGLTETERRALMLADNRIALNAGWDEDALAAEIKALADQIDIDMLGFGFSAAEIERLTGETARPDLEDSTFDYQEQFGVIVRCASAAEQEALFNRLRDEFGAENVKVVVV